MSLGPERRGRGEGPSRFARPVIEEAGPARIVNVSSSLHARGRPDRLFETLDGDPGFTRRKYVPFEAYGDSKLANVLFTRRLAKVLPSTVKAYSLHPGVIVTNLTRSMGLAGAAFRSVAGVFTKSVAQGAATTIYAATAPELDGQSGAYLVDCTITRPGRYARDDDDASKLWELSERAVASFAAPIAR